MGISPYRLASRRSGVDHSKALGETYVQLLEIRCDMLVLNPPCLSMLVLNPKCLSIVGAVPKKPRSSLLDPKCPAKTLTEH